MGYLSLVSFFKLFDVYFLLVCICVCLGACECDYRVACCNVGVVHCGSSCEWRARKAVWEVKAEVGGDNVNWALH